MEIILLAVFVACLVFIWALGPKAIKAAFTGSWNGQPKSPVTNVVSGLLLAPAEDTVVEATVVDTTPEPEAGK